MCIYEWYIVWEGLPWVLRAAVCSPPQCHPKAMMAHQSKAAVPLRKKGLKWKPNTSPFLMRPTLKTSKKFEMAANSKRHTYNITQQLYIYSTTLETTSMLFWRSHTWFLLRRGHWHVDRSRGLRHCGKASRPAHRSTRRGRWHWGT